MHWVVAQGVYQPRRSQTSKPCAPFFVIRVDGKPVGCGAIKLFGTEYGEIKRMYVRPQARSVGLAKKMLQRLEQYARERGVRLLRLETGIYQREAISLYEQAGFLPVSPFGEYEPSQFSLFFEKPVI